jgi:long-chain acyl-CoA synthetase
MAAVPRLYEKMYAGIVERGHKESGIKRKIFDGALEVAAQSIGWKCRGERPAKGLEWKWRMADRIVFSKIRAGIGGKIHSLSSGGAPISRDLIEFFWSIGLPVYQGYGLTETSPVVSTNTPKANKIGTVGRPIAGVEVKIAPDGEILVKGKCVMQGYHNKPDATREAFTADGWLSTGDIGALDEDGYLTITDRKKELLKTAGGKFIAPAPIENLLKSSPYIDNAMVIGDRRKFASALIVPNYRHIEADAREQGKEIGVPEQAVFDPWVLGLISREVERLTSSLAHYEKPKRFALITKDFTYANGELTYTLKLKRRVIEEHYKDVIEKIYVDVEEPRPGDREMD